MLLILPVILLRISFKVYLLFQNYSQRNGFILHFVITLKADRLYKATIVYVTSSVKTLHDGVQILTHF